MEGRRGDEEEGRNSIQLEVMSDSNRDSAFVSGSLGCQSREAKEVEYDSAKSGCHGAFGQRRETQKLRLKIENWREEVRKWFEGQYVCTADLFSLQGDLIDIQGDLVDRRKGLSRPGVLSRRAHRSSRRRGSRAPTSAWCQRSLQMAGCSCV